MIADIEKMRTAKVEAENERRKEGAQCAQKHLLSYGYSELATFAMEATQYLQHLREGDIEDPLGWALPEEALDELVLHRYCEPSLYPASLSEQVAFCDGFLSAIVEEWEQVETALAVTELPEQNTSGDAEGLTLDPTMELQEDAAP